MKLSAFPTVLLLAAFAAVSNISRATTVIAPTFEQLVDRAEVIFVGKVVGSRSEWREVKGKRTIFTLVEFESEEGLKGEPGKSVTLQFLGGTVGEHSMRITDMPEFKAGERNVLFVKGNGRQFCPIVGLYHGKIGVRKDEISGRTVLMKHDGNTLRDVGEIGAQSNGGKAKLASTDAPLSLDEFKGKIQKQLASAAPKK